MTGTVVRSGTDATRPIGCPDFFSSQSSLENRAQMHGAMPNLVQTLATTLQKP
jgi:hypothetical protein